MNWTHEKPLWPGWYRYREREAERFEEVIKVVPYPHGLFAYFANGEVESVGTKLHGEFSGPIPESEGMQEWAKENQ